MGEFKWSPVSAMIMETHMDKNQLLALVKIYKDMASTLNQWAKVLAYDHDFAHRQAMDFSPMFKKIFGA